MLLACDARLVPLNIVVFHVDELTCFNINLTNLCNKDYSYVPTNYYRYYSNHDHISC